MVWAQFHKSACNNSCIHFHQQKNENDLDAYIYGSWKELDGKLEPVKYYNSHSHVL